METQTMETKKFKLPNKTVMVLPIKRPGGWLPTDHEANFLFKHSTRRYGVPQDTRTGDYKNPLSLEEIEFFESKESKLRTSQGDFTVYRGEKSFWDGFRVKLDKQVYVLNLNDPMDYLRYKVLLANKDEIAPSEATQFDKATYKFKLVEEGYQEVEGVKKADKKLKAYSFFAEIQNSADRMTMLLDVYYADKPGKNIPPNAKKDWMVSEIERIITDDLDAFLSISKDTSFKEKVIIQQALKVRALKLEGTNYFIPEHDDPIAHNLQEMIDYLTNPANQENLLKIQARIERGK